MFKNVEAERNKKYGNPDQDLNQGDERTHIRLLGQHDTPECHNDLTCSCSICLISGTLKIEKCSQKSGHCLRYARCRNEQTKTDIDPQT